VQALLFFAIVVASTRESTMNSIAWLSRITFVALMCMCLNASAQSADEAAIRSARTIQTKAIADGDLDLVQSYWTADVTIRRALGQPVDGSAAARKVLEPAPGSSAAQVIYQRQSISVSVSPNWPLAYEEGVWSGYLGDVSSAPVIGGRYAAQWVKRDGKWLIRSEVFVALTCSGNACKNPAAP
jgi:ketosteroid isomerase-like protein